MTHNFIDTANPFSSNPSPQVTHREDNFSILAFERSEVGTKHKREALRLMFVEA